MRLVRLRTFPLRLDEAVHANGHVTPRQSSTRHRHTPSLPRPDSESIVPSSWLSVAHSHAAPLSIYPSASNFRSADSFCPESDWDNVTGRGSRCYAIRATTHQLRNIHSHLIHSPYRAKARQPRQNKKNTTQAFLSSFFHQARGFGGRSCE